MKKAVLAWGRMNPITVGHEKLVKKVESVAKKQSADPMVFLSHTKDKKKNPLTYDQKIKYAQAAFGPVVKKSAAKTIFKVLEDLDKEYDAITLVAGSDRAKEFNTLLNKYNGKNYNFDEINILSAGERDPDADDVSGMSASKLRQLALDGDQDAFLSGVPLKKSQAMKMYKDVKAAMTEEYILDQIAKLISEDYERKLSDQDHDEIEGIANSLPADEFKAKYGEKWKSVKIATATNIWKKKKGHA